MDLPILQLQLERQRDGRPSKRGLSENPENAEETKLDYAAFWGAF
jgi:hypothetical protein